MLKLTFFHVDFGKEFPSRTLWRGPSWHCPFPSCVLCPLLYRTGHFSKGEKRAKGAETRGGRGAASKGVKKEKRTRENRSHSTCLLSILATSALHSSALWHFALKSLPLGLPGTNTLPCMLYASYVMAPFPPLLVFPPTGQFLGGGCC